MFEAPALREANSALDATAASQPMLPSNNEMSSMRHLFVQLGGTRAEPTALNFGNAADLDGQKIAWRSFRRKDR